MFDQGHLYIKMIYARGGNVSLSIDTTWETKQLLPICKPYELLFPLNAFEPSVVSIMIIELSLYIPIHS